jgi:hypothetical protein
MTDEVNEMSAASRGSAGGIQGFTAELSDLLNRHSMENARHGMADRPTPT